MKRKWSGKVESVKQSRAVAVKVDQRIVVVKGFVAKHSHGTDAQLSISTQLLLDKLGKGALVSDALMCAEAAFSAVGLTTTLPIRNFSLRPRNMGLCTRRVA